MDTAPDPGIARWLQHLAVERRLSPRTLAAYRDDLARLCAHLGVDGAFDWRSVRAPAIRAFVAAEHRGGQSGKSLARRLSACRGFFRWLLKEGEVAANPVDGVRPPRAPRTLPHVLDADEVGALMDAVPAGAALATRDRAMLELFYSSALRLSELCGLRWQDLDLDDGMVRVLGKGAKTRLVPVGRMARAALLAWHAEAPAAPGAPVFPGRGGAPISPRAVQARLKHWARRGGVVKRVHPHLLRHSCASHVLESSGNLRAVQELLGHADIATTQVYTHLDFQHLSKVYDAAHPRARRKGG
jgi:integrase/recombinase XerC